MDGRGDVKRTGGSQEGDGHDPGRKGRKRPDTPVFGRKTADVARQGATSGLRWSGSQPKSAGDSSSEGSPPDLTLPSCLRVSSIALLGIPIDGQDATVEGLKADIANARGKMALIEMGDWGNAGGDSRVGLKSERFGADPPASLVELVDVSSREIYAACGFNSALWGGSQAASVREAWRLALFGVLAPLGRLVESELKAKLDDEVSLSWQELRASDLSGRARAFQSMVGGGMDISKAIAVAGLMVED